MGRRRVTDNTAVVAVLNSHGCQDKELMQMLRGLFFVEAHCQFNLSALHIAGQQIDLADDLSRDRRSAFLEKNPDAFINPTNVPLSLLQWLLHPVKD